MRYPMPHGVGRGVMLDSKKPALCFPMLRPFCCPRLFPPTQSPLCDPELSLTRIPSLSPRSLPPTPSLCIPIFVALTPLLCVPSCCSIHSPLYDRDIAPATTPLCDRRIAPAQITLCDRSIVPAQIPLHDRSIVPATILRNARGRRGTSHALVMTQAS